LNHMQKLNFKVADSISLNVADKKFDLHNDFELLGFNYDLDSRRFIMKWQKSLGDWVAPNLPNQLSLLFDNVAYLSISPRDPEMPYSEDSCLSFLGYLRPEDKTVMDGFLVEEMAQDDYDIIFIFQSGLAIKVFADTVTVNVTD
jgi:Na+-transporting NADH:ubiquinone oxidoreductase subunit NqrF